MDNVNEQLVTINKSTAQKASYIVLIFLIIVAGLFVFIFTAPLFNSLLLGLILGGVVIFLGLFLLSNSVFEFEYAFTNGELDIDKIIAKRKRKRLITVDIKGINDFGKYNDAPKAPSDTTIINAHDGTSGNTYYADFRSQKYGITRLYFSPDEKTMSNINKYLPRNLRNK